MRREAMLFKRKTESTIIPLNEGAKKIKEEYPHWSDDVCNAVAEKEIIVGMTREQVLATGSNPVQIIEIFHMQGKREQWVMEIGERYDYLFFDGEILTGMQKKRVLNMQDRDSLISTSSQLID